MFGITLNIVILVLHFGTNSDSPELFHLFRRDPDDKNLHCTTLILAKGHNDMFNMLQLGLTPQPRVQIVITTSMVVVNFWDRTSKS